jgi:hypothetical protein
VLVRTLNFYPTGKNVGVQVCMLKLSLRHVCMHKKVHAVFIHIIVACMVCKVLAKRRGILLVCAECGYILSRNSLVNGVHRVLVRGGGVLNFGMVQHIE